MTGRRAGLWYGAGDSKMPRPPPDIDDLLTKALQPFLRHGYHATSIETFVNSTGIGRGSIYNTFDSKRGLFIHALRHYIKTRQQRLQALLDLPSPRAAILIVFERMIEESPDGCFIVNTSVELSPHDREIAQIVSEALNETEQLFRCLIEHGQVAGEILSAVDPALTARGLLGLYLGLCVLIRAGSGAGALRELVRQASARLM